MVEYQHHFKILNGLNEGLNGEKLEEIVLEGIAYFEREKLWEYVKEYTEVLAVLFHKEHNFEKASYYFFSSHKASEEVFKKEALKWKNKCYFSWCCHGSYVIFECVS